jgi:predicted dehydrogenase
MSLRALVVGAGSAGEGHSLALQQAGVTVAAIASRTAATVAEVAKRLGIATPSTDWQASLRDLRPDIVAIATPGDSHVAIADAALSQRCHVFVDKPLAPTAADARQIWRRAQAAGVKTAYAATSNYQPAAMLARKLVADGAIGTLLEAEFVSHYHWSSLLPHGWPHLLSEGGGRLNNNFTHKLAIAESVCNGVILAVAGETRNDLKRAPAAPFPHDFREWTRNPVPPEEAARGEWRAVDSDWSYTVLARIGPPGSDPASAVSVTFRHSCLRRSMVRDYVAFYGTEGTIHVDQAYCQGDLYLWREGDDQFRSVPVGQDILDALPPQRTQAHWPKGWSVPQRAWDALARDFVADIEGKPHDRYNTIADGWRHQEVIDAVRARAGWTVLPVS